MTVKNHILITALSISGFGAFAAEPEPSEFFYQTPAGHSAGTIQAGYLDKEFKVTNGPGGSVVGTQKSTGLNQAGVRYEVGLNDMWSIEGALTYSLIKRDPANGGDSGSRNGLDDFQLNVKGTGHLEGIRVRYGAYSKIGLFPASYSSTVGGSNNFNNSSGRFTFTPYVGADLDVGLGLLGAKISYDLLKQDMALHGPDGIRHVYSGGQDFNVSVFYEISMSPSLLGLALNYNNEAGSVYDNTSQGNWISYGANLYARLGWIDGWSIIPSVGYDIYPNKAVADTVAVYDIDSGSAWNFQLGFRTTF